MLRSTNEAHAPLIVNRNLIRSLRLPTSHQLYFAPSLVVPPVPPPWRPFSVSVVNAPASWSEEYATATAGSGVPPSTISYLARIRCTNPC